MQADSDAGNSEHRSATEENPETTGDADDLEVRERPRVPQELGCFSRALYILDYHFLKPFLVYKYSAEKVKQDNAFFEEFESHADEMRDRILSPRNQQETGSEKNELYDFGAVNKSSVKDYLSARDKNDKSSLSSGKQNAEELMLQKRSSQDQNKNKSQVHLGSDLK